MIGCSSRTGVSWGASNSRCAASCNGTHWPRSPTSPVPVPGEPKRATVFDLLLNTASTDILLRHGEGEDAEHQSSAGWRGTLGVSGLLQRHDSRGIIPLVPDATTASGGAFAFERPAIGRLALLVGVRGDLRHLTADADIRLDLEHGTRSWNAFSGDASVVYRLLPSLALAVNVGQAWRAPALFELYANGPRPGEGRYECGSSSLDPETSLNSDASLRWESSRAHADASAFHTRISDYIYIAPTDGTIDGLRVYRYAHADATLVGGEASASVVATDALTLRGRVDAVRGTKTDDDPLPLVPPLRAVLGAVLGGELGGELHGHAGRHGIPYVSADEEYTARQTRLSQAERDATLETGRFPLQTNAYTLVDIGTGMSLSLVGRTTDVSVRARNATNARYRDFLNRYKEFAYAPGANVIVRLSSSF